jgi:hypothetical protein
MSASEPSASPQPDTRESVQNGVDPRIDNALRASAADLDQSYLRQLARPASSSSTARGDAEKSQPSTTDSAVKDEPIYLDFEPGDPRNPLNFSKRSVSVAAGPHHV